jgi:hypothetical protein
LKGYIPTFILKFPYKDIILDIKNELHERNLHKYEKEILESGWEGEYIIAGATLIEVKIMGEIAIGLFRDKDWDIIGDNGLATIMYPCSGCNNETKYTIIHNIGSYRCRTCGKHDGDHHLRGHASSNEIMRKWIKAKNNVKIDLSCKKK